MDYHAENKVFSRKIVWESGSIIYMSKGICCAVSCDDLLTPPIYGGFSGGREIYAIFGPKTARPSVP